MRLVTTAVTLIGVAVIVFFVIRIVPGNPIAMMLPPGATEGRIVLAPGIHLLLTDGRSFRSSQRRSSEASSSAKSPASEQQGEPSERRLRNSVLSLPSGWVARG